MPATPLYRDPNQSQQARVDDLLPRMSLAQKVGQMVLADGRHNASEQVEAGAVGAFLHIVGDVTFELQRQAEQTPLGIPLLFGIDAIHGHGFHPGATVFPTQLALSSAWNPELLEIMGRVTAREMLATGMHWTFSPVLCLTRDLRWGRVGETFGEDPFLIGELGKALVRGYQGERLSDPDSVLACAKHYAGYSETVGGRDATEAELSRRKLLTYFLPPFEAAARAGCKSFMTAYQCIDGESCTMSPWLLTTLLRERWGFDGFVVTDWDNVGRAHTQQKLYPSIAAAVPDAVRAGNDMIMVTPDFYRAALEQVQRSELAEADIDRACRRILALKFELGLFDERRYSDHDHPIEIVGSAAHREPLLRAALESIVLLKNDPVGEAPALPLVGKPKIAVLGPNADDTLAQLGDWSFGSGQAGLQTDGHPRHTVRTVLDGIRDRAQAAGASVTYCRGASVLSDDTQEIAEAVELARAADVAIVVVGDQLDQIGEECDRSDLRLTGGQMPLLRAINATGTPLVAVLVNSKPLCIPWLADNVAAIVEAWNPGMLGGDAVARILFGDDAPMGKLTVSFPRSMGQMPVYYQQIPGWHGNKHGTYDAEPLFPFGFGLSYTEFAYDHLDLGADRIAHGQSVTAEVRVENVGQRTGTEIVQLYLNDVFTTLSTPSKTLRGFQRVTLEPGESATVRFELPFDALGFVTQEGSLVVEPGEFAVLVGGSSRDHDLLEARFTYAP
jgi:beta-glucosidase